MRSEPIVVCGELTLVELCALLAMSCLYIGNDTGPMHIAAAVGTPTVSIFSARDFTEQWYPSGEHHVVIREDVPCSPCFKEECDIGLAFLDRVSTDRVLRAVDTQLSRLQAAPVRTAARR